MYGFLLLLNTSTSQDDLTHVDKFFVVVKLEQTRFDQISEKRRHEQHKSPTLVFEQPLNKP